MNGGDKREKYDIEKKVMDGGKVQGGRMRR